jgi:hypothetical protein
MLTTIPQSIDGIHGSVVVDGKPRLLMHAPASLRFDVPQDAHRVSGEYGFMPGAYQEGGNTDGVIFRVSLDVGQGSPRMLWERWVRPVTDPRDRGMQTFTVDLPQSVTGSLLLQTDVGPNGNGNWDWSVWSDIYFDKVANLSRK